MRAIRHISLIVLVTFAVSTHATPDLAPAPAPLAGTVLDEATGQPLPDASVILNSGLLHATTNSLGQFSFHDLPSGEYSVFVRHLGYHNQERAVRIVEGDARRLLLTLTSAALQLETVQVDASHPTHAYRVTEADIRSQSWNDIADAIRTIPGVQIYEQGGLGSRATVSLRGSRPDHVIVEVDGVTLNNGAGDAVDISTIPLATIRSIAVDPASQPGAPGGRIQIRTIPFQSTQQARWAASLEGHSPNALLGSFSATEPITTESQLSLHARYLRSDGDYDYANESGETRARINNDRERFSFNLATDSRFLGLSVESSAGIDQLEAGSPSPLYQPPTTEARLSETNWRAQIGLQASSQESYFGELLVFVNGSERAFVSPREQFNPATQQTILHTPVDVDDTSLRGGLRYSQRVNLFEADTWASHADLLGESTLESFKSVDQLGTGSVSRTGGEVHRSTLAEEARVSLRWQGDNISVRTQLDGRVDHVNDIVNSFAAPWGSGNETHVSGRARVLLAPVAGRWSVEAGTGSAVALPSYTHRFLVESVFALGNPDLEPERVSDLHAGFNWVQPITQQTTLSSTLHGFYRRTTNLIIWQRNWRGQYFPDNLDEATARGLEFAATMQSDSRLKELQASVTWQRVLNTSPDSPYNGNRVPFQPDLYGNVSLRLRLLAALDLLTDARFSSRRYSRESNLDPLSTAGVGMDPYSVVNLALRWNQPLTQSGMELTTSVGVENVTNTEYQLLERMPAPGRIWVFKLTLQRRS
jgi:outer membrane cobalamin receptor